jgi:hypothetical protein
MPDEKKMNDPELWQEIAWLKSAQGTLEDRITTLEIVKRYDDKPKKPKRDILKMIDDNAEIIAGVCLFLALNLILWEKLNAN